MLGALSIMDSIPLPRKAKEGAQKMFRRIDESKEAIFQGLVALGRGAKKLEISTERDTFFLKRIKEDLFEVRVIEKYAYAWHGAERRSRGERRNPRGSVRGLMDGRRFTLRSASDRQPGRNFTIHSRTEKIRRGRNRRQIKNGTPTTWPFRNVRRGDRRHSALFGGERRGKYERRIEGGVGRRNPTRIPRRSNTRRTEKYTQEEVNRKFGI